MQRRNRLITAAFYFEQRIYAALYGVMKTTWGV